MSLTNPASMITIAPLGDADLQDISLDPVGQGDALGITSASELVIKQEPVDTFASSTTTTTKSLTSLRFSNVSLPLIQGRSASSTGTITLSPVTSSGGLRGIQSVVPVSTGLLRFTGPGVSQTRPGLNKMVGAANRQPLFLIPAGSVNQKGVGLHQGGPIRLVPIQPKKTQAVVAPQAKQSSSIISVTPQVVPSSMSKGIISFSQENPDEFAIGRSEPMFTPKFGVSGMIFNSRTVTAGGQVKYNKDYLCNLCKHMSDSYQSFKSHFTSTHMFNCDYCPYKAFSRYEVVMHTKTSHTEALDDLRGYEMFDDADTLPAPNITVATTVLPSVTTVTVSTAKSSGVSVVGSSGLITVPVMSMNGNKLIIQNLSKSSGVSPNAATSGSGKGNSPNGYFTYKIIQPAKDEPKKYECDLCQYQTYNLKTMYEHASCHTMSDLIKSGQGSTTWECFYCNFKSFDQVKVVAHVSAAHPKQHIQLKRYTSTSVIKSQLSTASSSSASTPTTATTTTTTTSTACEEDSTKLVSKPAAVVTPDVARSDGEKTPGKDDSLDETSATAEQDSRPGDYSPDKAKHKKTSKDVEEEDDGTAMWGCYYCDFEDQDRHCVVAHVKAEHAGRKIVITRRRLQVKDKASESPADEKKDEECQDEGSKPDQEHKDPTRKDYSSLIIKLKSKTKNDHKTLSLLRKELHDRKSKQSADSDGGTTALANLSSLMNNVENSSKNLVPDLSPDGTELEMPVLEPMVMEKSNDDESHAAWKADSSKLRNKHRIRLPIGLKKEIKVRKRGHPSSPLKKQATRVKSDLTFDQAEVVVLDHVPDDLKVDVSQLYVFNRIKQEAQCNICHRTYTGKMAYGHMREHLMIHTGERIWGCPYCVFRCNRRFTLYMHVKKVHPDMPIKLVRRRPYQVKQSESLVVQYNPNESRYGAERGGPVASKLRGPRSHRERLMLEMAEYAWECRYCSRKDVFKGTIKIHMKIVHPERDFEVEPRRRDRPLNLLRRLISENRLPMKEAKVCIFQLESMKKYKVLNEILEENGHNLIRDLDLDDPLPSEVDGEEVAPSDKTSTEESDQTGPKPHALSHAKYQCPYCSTRGVRPSTVKLHILSVHPDKELYIHDLRVSRRTQNQHYLYVCREKDCKFMTIMQQALYAHVAKNPTHVNPGVDSSGREEVQSKLDETVSQRVTSLRRKSDRVEAKSAGSEVKPTLPDDIQPQNVPEQKQDKQQPASPPPPAPPPPPAAPAPAPPLPAPQEEEEEQQEQPQQTQEQQPEEVVAVTTCQMQPHSESSVPIFSQSQSLLKKKRLRPALPDNHREGITLNNTLLTCRYCDFSETTSMIMIKNHLLSEHSAQVPVAINRREKAKRKHAKLHLCPMDTCDYATYFEKAFSIHLKEAHNDVFFPFMQQLRESSGENDRDERPGEGKEGGRRHGMDDGEGSGGATSDDSWGESTPKVSRKRRWSSSDDEPEWRPNNRNPKKKAARSRRRTLASRLQAKLQVPPPQSLVPGSSHPRSLLRLQVSSQHPRSLLRTPLQISPKNNPPGSALDAHTLMNEAKTNGSSPPPQKKKRNVIPCNLATIKAPSPQSEAITEYPSAVGHIKTRFLCFQCSTTLNTLPEMKTHLLEKHEGKVNFCMDLYARYMRKKQSVFLCVQPSCDFCCKTWATMRSHWTQQHPGTITEDALHYFDKSIENSPAFRKTRKQNGVGEKRKAAMDDSLQEDGVDASVKGGGDGQSDSAQLTDDGMQQNNISADLRRHPHNGQQNKHPRMSDCDTEVRNHSRLGHSERENSLQDVDGNGSDDASKQSAEGREEVSSPKAVPSDVGPCEGKDDVKGGATMDVMYQCSHCTFLSTSKTNIQMHLVTEHSINEPEYTEIGAEFDHDGRVNMSVSVHHTQRKMGSKSPQDTCGQDNPDSPSTMESERNKSKGNESDSNASGDTSDPSAETPSVSKIKPLKLSVRDGEVTKVTGNENSNGEGGTDDGEGGDKKKDEEESDESDEDDDDDDDEEEKTDDSSSSSSDEESDDDDDDDDDDEDEDESSESGSSEETESSENESKASAASD